MPGGASKTRDPLRTIVCPVNVLLVLQASVSVPLPFLVKPVPARTALIVAAWELSTMMLGMPEEALSVNGPPLPVFRFQE